MSSKMQFVPDFPKDLKAYNSKLSLETAYQRILSVGLANGDIGCIQPEELADSLLQSAKKKFVLRAYDGFEPSGRF
ncbi:hypothetical protein MHBO_004744 [Bonamia ostreae]|uniref:Uncharacterized protein n=1 Tax=Bonamia ostreae TaxID=126728 RepID=A0ABV2AUT6_9EUKA